MQFNLLYYLSTFSFKRLRDIITATNCDVIMNTEITNQHHQLELRKACILS